MASPQQQINFEYWANAQSLAAIIAAQSDAEALSLLAHTVAMSNLWAARVEGSPGTVDPWPALTVADLHTELIRLKNRWLRLADRTASGAQVQYQNRAGESCSNLFADVLQEILLHGAHHRGQIAFLLRAKGFEPPRSTDFIPALRTQAF